MVINKLSNHLPYLSNSYDHLDEYHTLDSNVSFDDIIEWFAVIFKKLKIKSFEDVKNVREYQILNIARKDPGGFWGTFEVDFWGGMFYTVGMYGQSFYYDWMPKELQSSKGEKSPIYQKRFEFLNSKIKEKYE